MPNRDDIDWRLLGALEVLVRERNVTRAAKTLGLSQPAMSHALKRLRHALQDPILVRTTQGMLPTPRATELAQAATQALGVLREALATTKAFDAATSTQRFRLGATDHSIAALLAQLAGELEREAPQIDLEISAWRGNATFREVESGELDLAIAIGELVDEPAGLHRRSLFGDRFVCLVRADHPTIRASLDLETFVKTPHVLVSPRGGHTGIVDTALSRVGMSRRVAVVVPNFLAVPLIVAKTDYIATLSAYVALPLARAMNLRVLPTPIAVPESDWFCVWHERTHKDPAHRWLRDRLSTLAAKLNAANS